MRKRLIAGGGALALASTALLATALPASADYFGLDIADYSATEDPLLKWASDSEICDDPVVFLTNDDGAMDVSAVTIDGSGTSGSVNLAVLPIGYYDLEINCESSGGDVDRYSLEFNFARYTVTKAVEGDAPADALFGFETNATELIEGGSVGDTVTFEFELAAGESKTFYDFQQTGWNTDEVDDGGASEVRASETEFRSLEVGDFLVTFTNVFPEKAQPTPTPKPQPEPTKNEPVDEPPAKPAGGSPSFTG